MTAGVPSHLDAALTRITRSDIELPMREGGGKRRNGRGRQGKTDEGLGKRGGGIVQRTRHGYLPMQGQQMWISLQSLANRHWKEMSGALQAQRLVEGSSETVFKREESLHLHFALPSHRPSFASSPLHQSQVRLALTPRPRGSRRCIHRAIILRRLTCDDTNTTSPALVSRDIYGCRRPGR